MGKSFDVLYSYDEFMNLDEDVRRKYFEMVSDFAEPHMYFLAAGLLNSVVSSFFDAFHKSDSDVKG